MVVTPAWPLPLWSAGQVDPAADSNARWGVAEERGLLGNEETREVLLSGDGGAGEMWAHWIEEGWRGSGGEM